MSQAKRVVLVSRPAGEPRASDFRIEEFAPPSPGPGEVLLRTIWLSPVFEGSAVTQGAGLAGQHRHVMTNSPGLKPPK